MSYGRRKLFGLRWGLYVDRFNVSFTFVIRIFELNRIINVDVFLLSIKYLYIFYFNESYLYVSQFFLLFLILN